MELPTCQCISELTTAQKFGAWYGAVWTAAGEPEGLPTYDCIGQYSIEQILDFIYCAYRAL